MAVGQNLNKDNKEGYTLNRRLTVTQITMDAYQAIWSRDKGSLNWNCLFMLPFWLDTVCAYLGVKAEPTILTVHDGPVLLGIAPLAVAGQNASFLGSPDVCDYQDMVVAPGKESLVMQAVMDHLAGMGVQQLDLRTLRPDAVALGALNTIASQQGLKMQVLADEAAYEATLPETWDDFLGQLNSKQRHEVRRKIRRLESQSAFTFQMAPCDASIEASAAQFIQLFQMNRTDKADFMNPKMAAYFKALIQALAQHRLLRLFFLDVDGQPAATVLCFDYGQVRYLYNSGYDAQYQPLSVGILSKVFSIRQGIQAGCRCYDFLKGEEVYKERTGGQKVPLYRYQLAF
jgi:CelD/BcsL family acetyltransferase involved in cellulose biosynthesis